VLESAKIWGHRSERPFVPHRTPQGGDGAKPGHVDQAAAPSFAKVIWTRNSPDWHFDDATLEHAAVAFDNPGYVDVLHRP
jgi:hypothetical protein